ncbi:MAG: hypothetical protein JJU00_00270 [Opitutales bacterium]|nr:hypothetical protein [Opitutales bacterium]
MKHLPHLPRIVTYPLLSVLSLALLPAQPVENPVQSSPVDLGDYDASWVDTMVDWSNVTVTAAVPDATEDQLPLIQDEIFTLSEAGGGVLYFPAGVYTLGDNLYLADGVVLRGAAPAEANAIGDYTVGPDNLRIYDPVYVPPTRFQFPFYEHDWSNNMRPGADGSIRDNYFKRIQVGRRDGGDIVPDATSASNLGIVHIDIESAFISIADRAPGDQTWGVSIPKNRIAAHNILIFGNRLNNAFVPEPGIPESGQNAWQIWPTRTRGKIDVSTGGYTLVANNAVMDKHYRYHALGDTSAQIMDIRFDVDPATPGPPLVESYLSRQGQRVETQDGGHGLYHDGRKVNYVRTSDGYGIRINHIQNYANAHTPAQEPSKYRSGLGIINNFVFTTTRVAIVSAGNGLVVHANAVVDIPPSIPKPYTLDESGRSRIPINNTPLFQNRAVDVTGGYGVVISDNYFLVTPGRTSGGVTYTPDGETARIVFEASAMDFADWVVRGNTAHSDFVIQGLRYINGLRFIDNNFHSGVLSINAIPTGSQGRVGNVYFEGNTAAEIYAQYVIRPMGMEFVDGGGNAPTPEERTIGGLPEDSSELVDGDDGDDLEDDAPETASLVMDTSSIPGVEILYPRLSDIGDLVAGEWVDIYVRVTRDPDDPLPAVGFEDDPVIVQVFDGVTGYPANGTISSEYWNCGEPASSGPVGVFMHLVDPDPVTGHLGGGLYQGSWLVPDGFPEYGMMIAEVRVAPQASIYPPGYWVERNWAFLSED